AVALLRASRLLPYTTPFRSVEARRVARVVDHRAADAAPRVVLAELHRVLAAGDPLVGPVELVRAGLVGDPVLVEAGSHELYWTRSEEHTSELQSRRDFVFRV